jgi:outer membrane immunogenic protein
VTKLASCFAAIAAMVATPVFAADMATKAPPPATVPAASWAGFYIGANGGYGWDHDPTVSYTPNDILSNDLTCGGAFGGDTCIPPATFGISGALGGIQAGYNWQSDRWLAGLETNFDWSGIKGSSTSNFQGPAPQILRQPKPLSGSAQCAGVWVGSPPIIFCSTARADWLTAAWA